jgi:anti-sigma B factor antagonist
VDELEYRADIARVGATTYVVALAGELDLHVRPEEFLDSSIVGVLLHYLRELRDRGGALVLVSDDPRILQPFAILGLDRVFTIHARLDDALAELAVGDAIAQKA